MNELDFIKYVRRGQGQKAMACLQSLVSGKLAAKRAGLLKEAGMSDRTDKIRSKLSSLSYSTLKFKTKEEFDAKVKELADSGVEFDPLPDKLQVKLLTGKS